MYAHLEGVDEGDPGEVPEGQHVPEPVRGDVHGGQDRLLIRQ